MWQEPSAAGASLTVTKRPHMAQPVCGGGVWMLATGTALVKFKQGATPGMLNELLARPLALEMKTSTGESQVWKLAAVHSWISDTC